MHSVFHWLRINVFCYATENEELIHNAMAELIGADETECDIADSEHGNKILIFSREIRKQKEIVPIFQRLGTEICNELKNHLENMVDDDCVIYLRLEKQELVQGRYKIAHHGDVLSITGKIVSHPARKEIAVGKMMEFLNSLESAES